MLLPATPLPRAPCRPARPRARRGGAASACAPAPPGDVPPRLRLAEAGSVLGFWTALRAATGPAGPPANPDSVRGVLHRADPSLNQSLISEGTTISQLFDQDKWERHRSVGRYWRHVQARSLLTSTVFRRLSIPILSLVAFSLCVAWWNTAVPSRAAHLHLAPISLAAPILGLLLVFRLNNSYQRFAEARELWGGVVRHARDVARLVAGYGPPGDARVQALLGHLVAWAWLLKAQLRAGRSRADPGDPTRYADDPGPPVEAAVGAGAAARLLAAPNRPFACMLAITALLRSLRAELPDVVVRRVEETLILMGASVGGCERILSTPLPLSYTRFTGRALVVWLLCLPFALHAPLGAAMVPSVFFLAYLCLGVDEIGIEIEEPFSILPLQALCQAAERDVRIAQASARELQQAWPGGFAGDPNVSA